MITCLFSSRVKNNPDSNIECLLDSAVDCIENPKDKIEFIIKYDSDDDEAPSQDFFSKYPFSIKKLVLARGEGRHSIHLDHLYCFAQRNQLSKFILIASDDFTFYRPGFADDILAIQEKYCVVGANRPQVEIYKNRWRNPEVMEFWKHNEGVCLPCFSVPLIEAVQNFGWQCNTDNWQTLLTILMYERYNLDIWKTIPSFYMRNPSDGTSGYSPTYNNMEIDGSRNCQNEYYFRLVEQQAKNIYLNMIYG